MRRLLMLLSTRRAFCATARKGRALEISSFSARHHGMPAQPKAATPRRPRFSAAAVDDLRYWRQPAT